VGKKKAAGAAFDGGSGKNAVETAVALISFILPMTVA
jgi:hypothetical protein